MELIFIIILAFVVIGPQNTVQYAQKAGKKLNEIVKSPLWSSIVKTSNEIRSLPRKLIQDAGVEEAAKEIETNLKFVSSDVREKMRKNEVKIEKGAESENTELVESLTDERHETSTNLPNHIADKP